MTRNSTVGAAQMGPIARDESRSNVVDRYRRSQHFGIISDDRGGRP
ncbi:MAG: hypothetical protein QGM48_02270 [Actinomycetota bacterium]|nr:hypothetical protein [Actinomycetota bacterium]MDK1016466.1 hypothetical protein [Actinomycetota bacterium]MDK1026220.1 hypothetical protein [Actinomycetota bacterium]MDK1037708.1 hypothetical protein [Actinomycetota bacterium]MDK1096009.1 hypothetical protein [Actinomycetota bacterium]